MSPSEISDLQSAEQPTVTCLCPTYGRFHRLREAVACFLLQDYPRKKLLILNDAAVPLRLRPPGPQGPPGPPVAVVNAGPRYQTLGHKRQALLETARAPLAAHWDDDDLYLPWHLSHCVDQAATWNVLAPALAAFPIFPSLDLPGVEAPRGEDAVAVMQGRSSKSRLRRRMVKPRGAWWLLGSGADFTVRGPCHNVFEGQVVFDRERALQLGGYPPTDSGQAKALMDKFRDAGEFLKFDPWPHISYCYRWNDGVKHVSAAKTGEKFAAGNRDFGLPVRHTQTGPPRGNSTGHAEPLIPDGVDPIQWARDTLRPLFDRLLEGLSHLIRHPDVEECRDQNLKQSDLDAIKTRLESALAQEQPA